MKRRLNEQTSKKIASKAGKLLKKAKSRVVKSVAASALAQRRKNK